MRIALFGGRFDPPHVGHIAIANYILRSFLHIDQVWFLPAHTHPWRSIIASDVDRLAMLRFLENEKIKVKDIEVVRGGATRTIDTVRQLQKELPQHTYFWICGIDQIADFPKWNNFDELQRLITFLVIPRKGYDTNIPLPRQCLLISENYPVTNLSSSEIRDRISKGESVTGLVPGKVEEYINKRKLYK